jgi:hypothetical protein
MRGAHALVERTPPLASQRLDAGALHQARHAVFADSLACLVQIAPDAWTAVAAPAQQMTRHATCSLRRLNTHAPAYAYRGTRRRRWFAERTIKRCAGIHDASRQAS